MFFEIMLGVLVVLLWFGIWCYEQKRKFRSLNTLPGPQPLPVLGNVLEFGRNPVDKLKNFVRLANEYGPMMIVWIGPNKCYLISSDPDFAGFILNSPKHLTKLIDYKLFKPWLCNGLLLSTESYWQKRRKIITPAFHFKILEKYLSNFTIPSNILITKLSKETGKDVCNIYPYITAYTLDSICETAMGTLVNAQENPANEYVTAVKGLCNIVLDRAFSSWMMFDQLFQFSNLYKIQQKFLRIVHGFSRSVIEKRKEKLLANIIHDVNKEDDDYGGKKKTAFLDLILEARIDGKTLSNEDIREEVDTFMFEGHDTTASAISFALYELAKNPDVQEKLVSEFYELFGNDKNRQLTLTDLSNMKYTELILKETLRLYPSVPYYGRQLTENTYYDGILLPKDLQITLLPFHMHRRSDLFKNPEKFYPERFLSDSEDTKHPFAYIPFSAGPRNCIGQKFAMNEMKITLYKVLTTFELLPADKKHDVVLSGEITLKSANGISVRLRNRILDYN